MGEIFLGGGLNARTPHDFAQNMLARLRTRLPAAQGAEIDQILLGTRPVPMGGLPAIGALGDTPGLYIAVMHSGITLCALVGQLVTDDLLGQPPALLRPYRPKQ